MPQSQKRRNIDGSFESTKSENVEGRNIVICVKKKCFSYIKDKVVSLRRNFSKALVSWPGLYCCFRYSFYQKYI